MSAPISATAAIAFRTRVTLAEARRIVAECESNYQRGSERFALANTIISLYAACEIHEDNDADQQEEIERLRTQVAALQGVAR